GQQRHVQPQASSDRGSRNRRPARLRLQERAAHWRADASSAGVVRRRIDLQRVAALSARTIAHRQNLRRLSRAPSAQVRRLLAPASAVSALGYPIPVGFSVEGTWRLASDGKLARTSYL